LLSDRILIAETGALRFSFPRVTGLCNRRRCSVGARCRRAETDVLQLSAAAGTFCAPFHVGIAGTALLTTRLFVVGNNGNGQVAAGVKRGKKCVIRRLRPMKMR
jgi:hypothetical protein